MIDFESKVKSLQLSWISRVLNNPNNTWHLIITKLLNNVPFDYILRCRSDCTYLLLNIPLFYQNIYKTWKTFTPTEPSNKLDILKENIWLNKHITIENKPIMWTKWFSHGIKVIADLLDINGIFLTQVNLKNKYNISCNFIEHLQIRQAIPLRWREILTLEKTRLNRDSKYSLLIEIDNIPTNFVTLKSKHLYWNIIHTKVKHITPNCIKRWEETYPIDHSCWAHIFQIPFTCCRETYLQSFQYRIIHRILPCNNWLYKLKITDTNICTYRHCTTNDIDDIYHFLIACFPVQNFWNDFVTWWNNLNYLKLNPLVEENIILGFLGSSDEDIVLNFCLILCKHYIYTCKRKQEPISILHYLRLLKHKLVIEEEIHTQNCTLNKFNIIWKYILDLL